MREHEPRYSKRVVQVPEVAGTHSQPKNNCDHVKGVKKNAKALLDARQHSLADRVLHKLTLVVKVELVHDVRAVRLNRGNAYD